MKHLLSFCLLLAAVSLFANAGVFMGSGQNVVLDSTAQIQMAEEVVTMRPMRGDYPVDTSCRNMDPMKFHCVFKLRNLTDQEVTVPVGFPISAEAFLRRSGDEAVNQAVLGDYGSFSRIPVQAGYGGLRHNGLAVLSAAGPDRLRHRHVSRSGVRASFLRDMGA